MIIYDNVTFITGYLRYTTLHFHSNYITPQLHFITLLSKDITHKNYITSIMGIYIYIATQHLAENLERELYSMVLQTMFFMLLVEEQIVFPHQGRVILLSLNKGQSGRGPIYF